MEMVTTYAGEPIVMVHRLDRDTSGVMLFSRKPAIAKYLGAFYNTYCKTCLHVYVLTERQHKGR